MIDVALKHGAILDDRFMLQRQLGAGGCGAVWLATDGASNGREVVLKILHPHFDRFSLAVKQLAREAEVLAQLAHPNIAKPILFSAAGAHTFLAMEYIEGRSLDQEIGAHTRLDQHFTAAEVRTMFEELCSAMGHAHSKTVIHRDLKPQNVMVTKRGASLSVKVLDFGIAKLVEGNIFDATTFGRRLGSMFYMSPEQCKGEPADERSDIFSLGVVLFEVITLRRTWAWDAQGRPVRAFDTPVPADGSNALSSVLMRVATATRPRPSDSRPRLPPKLDEVVTRAMAIEPERRYQTVEAFMQELSRALTGVAAMELGGDMVTVKSPVPSNLRGRPSPGDPVDTFPSLVPEPIVSDLPARASVRVERTEALVEVKEREAKEREAAEAPAAAKKEARPSVWRVGGRDAAELAPTAMMAEVKERADSSATGPTIGVKDAERILAGFAPPKRGRDETDDLPRGPSGIQARAASESEAHVPVMGAAVVPAVAVPAYDGDPHGTVRGALAPEGPGQNARPSWRGRLPVPTVSKVPDALITAPSDVVPEPPSPEGGTWGGSDPNPTPLASDLEVDVRGPGQGGTELLYQVADLGKLSPDAPSGDDLTPIHAAELHLVSGAPEPARPSPVGATEVLRTPVPQLREGPRSTVPDTVDVTEPSVVALAVGVVKRHKLAVIGLIGMVLAFVVGVVLARWAAEEARRNVVPVPIEVKRPAHKP